MGLSDSIFGNYTMLNRNRIRDIVSKVNALKDECASITTSQEKRRYVVEPQHVARDLTEEEIAFLEITNEFRRRLREGESIEDILPQALAVCREATKRRLGMFHFDVQVEAACAMIEGSTIAEMKTGEGKTLVQILVAYVFALDATKSLDPKEWSNVHVMTANEALATRDATSNSGVFSLLGFSTSNIPKRDDVVRNAFETVARKVAKQKCYQADIIYSTATTIAFDYLEDNTTVDPDGRYITKPFGYAIIDEADDILLDQATNPLILSGTPSGLSEEYKKQKEAREKNYRDLCIWATKLLYGEPPLQATVFSQYKLSKAESFKGDYAYYEDEKQVYLSDKLREQIYAGFENASPEEKAAMIEREDALVTCIIAKHSYNKGVEYRVDVDSTGKAHVVLIDSNTGRIKAASKYTKGFQEAVEYKEEYLENNTPTGQKRYHVVLSRPTATKAMCTYPDFLKQYGTVCGMTGTSDIAEFEEIYGLQTYEVPSRKTNVRIDEADELYVSKEKKLAAILNEVIKCREKLQPVLIGTSSDEESREISAMLKNAGIRHKLLNSGNEEIESKIIATAGLLGSVTVATNMAGRGTDIKLGDGVKDVGGLYVIGVSKNKNVRIDNQLKGRAARQGDPGRSKYFMSFDDAIQRQYFPDGSLDSLKKVYASLDGPITAPATIALANKAQKAKEGSDKEARKTAEKFNLKFTEHKNYIYGLRKKILLSRKKEDLMTFFSENLVPHYVDFLSKTSTDEETRSLIGHIITIEGKNINYSDVNSLLNDRINNSIQNMDDKTFKATRTKLLNVIDVYWISHIETLEDLKNNAYISSSSDPFKDFEKAAMEDFSNKLLPTILNEMFTYVTNTTLNFGEYEIQYSSLSPEESGIVL